jgi:thioredoxin
MAKVALLIGVSEYAVGLNPLPAAVKDVVALERILKDSEMGDFDEVKILTNPEPQEMQYEVETLFSGRSKDDFVLLFFSGHGIKDDNNNLYFATRITQKSAKGDLIRSTAVPARFVHEVMNNSRAKRQAIILDCCFSGAFDPNLLSKDDGSVDLQGQLGAEGRVVLTSSSSTQYSFEQQGSDLSLYTRYLIEGIETGAGDLDEDGKVSVRELHEYATSKVQETAPSMTPKLITLKDFGFDLVLAKAKVTDPKLKYRKTASRYSNAGKIRPAGRAVLNTLRQQLDLTIEDATQIENDLLRPYQERLVNLQHYREALIAEAEHEYPLGESALDGLNELQQMLGLRDENILPIKQEIETRFANQFAAYQQKLAQYKQTLSASIQRTYPLGYQDYQDLKNLSQSLGLKTEDVNSVSQPLLQQAAFRHEERLKEDADRQKQEQEKADYENKRQRYEQEFSRVIQLEYPLNQFVSDGLKNFHQQLGLKVEDVAKIEQHLRESMEAKYQKKLKQQEQAEQQKIVEMEKIRKIKQEKPRQKGVISVLDSTFEKEVLESDIPVLVDFWAPWAGPCRMVAPNVEEIAETYAGVIKVVKLDTDENPKSTAQYGVRSVPTLMIFKGGQRVDTIVGAVPISTVAIVLDKYI